jgi:hypothetical protein
MRSESLRECPIRSPEVEVLVREKGVGATWLEQRPGGVILTEPPGQALRCKSVTRSPPDSQRGSNPAFFYTVQRSLWRIRIHGNRTASSANTGSESQTDMTLTPRLSDNTNVAAPRQTPVTQHQQDESAVKHAGRLNSSGADGWDFRRVSFMEHDSCWLGTKVVRLRGGGHGLATDMSGNKESMMALSWGSDVDGPSERAPTIDGLPGRHRR